MDEDLEVFTTRPDTIFGVTYMVVAPEHSLVQEWLKMDYLENPEEVREYINQSKKKSELERLEGKEKTGVLLKGITATNPATEKSGMNENVDLPIFVSDYVLAGYGTGAIMAVPAHDQRDYDFAVKYNLPIREAVAVNFEPTDEMQTRDDVETLNRRVVDMIIESPEGGKFLLEKDSHWHLVGGGVEEGESVEEAIAKEVTEETGYVDFEINPKPIASH